jgi:drug/metabolite transporter (DMT)-like permease
VPTSPIIPTHSASDNLRGIAAMLVSMAALIANDAFFKLAAGHLPLGQAIFMRGLFASLLTAALIVYLGVLDTLPRLGEGKVLFRGVAEIVATLLYLTALVRMPIAEATAILQFTPLAITAGAAIFLGAAVGWRRWTATVVGLIGVLVIIRPGAAVFNPYAAVALASVVFIAARDLTTRRLGGHIPTIVIAFSSALAVMISSLGFLPFEQWHWPEISLTLALLASGACLLAGQFWVIVAMRTGDIALVAPFRYSIILWAILAGFLVWRELPDLATWIGIAIVTAAGLYTFLREYRLAKAARP